MPKYFKIIALAFLVSQSVYADLTVHVLSPFTKDTSVIRQNTLLMYKNSEVGYFPGSSMVPEGGGWFYYTYRTTKKTDNAYFQIATMIDVPGNVGRIEYSGVFRIDSLFLLFPPEANEIWIDLSDTTKPYKVYAAPPNGKVIFLLNPWPDNSPQISIHNRFPMKMKVRTDICGWYACYYAGPPDGLDSVVFNDYYHTQKYTSSGLANGQPIDLRAWLTTPDTVYILPKPFPYGPPDLSATFPGKTGDCGFRKVSAIFRDWKLDSVSFFNDPVGARSGGKGMVQTTLQAPDYRPQLTPEAAAIPTNPPVSSWFKTFTFPDGRRNDTCIDLTLLKGDDGRWTYNSDDMGGFFPLDSFNDPNNIKYWDRIDKWTNPTKDVPGARLRNFHFSMEMHLQFVYRRNKGLVFNFCGDDDLWIFINNRLAVDLGGLNYRVTAVLDVDQTNTTRGLGLVDGQIYNMDIFFAERNPVGSNLIVQTTMDLKNSADLFYKDTLLATGKTRYLILEHVQSLQKTCGFTPLENQIDTPMVHFFLQGPQFTAPLLLSTGLFYGGITVDTSKSTVIIDSASITGLASGEYRITFTSTYDISRSGYLVFTVAALPPDHLDILTDSLVLNHAKDAVIDSIFMPEDMVSTQAYAVLRDKNGGFLSNASAETWTSRDTAVVSVAPLPGDKSRCVITKKATGSAWIVVSQAGLKPDSVRVAAVAPPKYPVISAAVMLDTNADIIPDLLFITLSDTFKTGQALDSVVITYRGQTYSVSASKTALLGKTLLVPVSGTTTDAKPSGSAAIFMTVDGSGKSRSKAFTDGVGPALVSATVLGNDGPDPDVLYLTFSESVSPSSLIGKQLLLMSAGSSDTVSLTITSYVNTGKDSVFTVSLLNSGKRPLAGDRVRLVPGSQGGTIEDASANKPGLLNRSVVLGFKPGPMHISAAWYRDGNADGFIDTVAIVFKRPVQISTVQTVVVKWILPAMADTVQLNTLMKLSDSMYLAPVNGGRLVPNMIRTNVPMEVLVAYKDFPDIPPRSAVAVDSAGPVIIDTAKMVYANTLDSNFLTVPFSENVRHPGNHPFYLWSQKFNMQYQLKLTQVFTDGKTYTYRVDAVEGGIVPYVGNGDLLWINTDTLPLVSDTSGCTQRNPLNHRVVLHVTMQPPKWNVRISKNPYTPAGGTGTEITISSESPIINADQYTLKIDFFDMIGNQVISISMKPKGKGWSYIWDGRNKNSRIVGSGVYSAVIGIYENNNLNSTKRIRIGIKR